MGKESSGSFTFSGGSGADVAVAADGHRVGVEGIHIRGTLGQLHCHHLRLIVGADTVVRLNVRWFQHRFLWRRNTGLRQAARQTSGVPFPQGDLV